MSLPTEDLIEPWNSIKPEAESNWEDVDETLSLFDDLPENELFNQAEQFFSHLHQRWQSIDEQNLEELFRKKFSSFLPFQWLETLLEQAKLLVFDEKPKDSLERLVTCVKPLLASWSDEDLQVLARSFARSMLGTQELKEISWEERSQIEQGKLTLAIAQEILMEFEKSQTVKE